MYCCLMYITYDELLRQSKMRSSVDLYKKENEVPIKNKTLLFNPNCFIGIIMDYLLKEAGIPTDVKAQVDLIDDTMHFLNINEKTPSINGNDILSYYKTYHLIISIDDQKIPFLSCTSPEFIYFNTKQTKHNQSTECLYFAKIDEKPSSPIKNYSKSTSTSTSKIRSKTSSKPTNKSKTQKNTTFEKKSDSPMIDSKPPPRPLIV